MKIIILGAGQVGSTLADHLARENNDITVIDHNPNKLLKLQEHLDIRTIPGHASYPNLLRRAGAEDADLLIAVTSNDETNMIACQVGYTLFQIPTKIARIRSLQYLAYDSLFGNDALPVDVMISPEQLVTNHIRRLIEYPDAMQVLDFTNKKVKMVAVRAHYGGHLVGHAIKYLSDHLAGIPIRIVAIFRNGKPIPISGNTLIESNDDVYFLSSSNHIRQILMQFRHVDQPNKRIIIAGGGNIGTRLGISLEHEYKVKVIEHNFKKVEHLAAQLSAGIVLHGDAADQTLLINENIDHTDIFCAVTNSDETNIMSALLAKQAGARKVMSLINQPAYVDVVENSVIDVAISPQQTTIGSLLSHVRGGEVVKVYSLRRGQAEAIEAIVSSEAENSKIAGKRVQDIKLPPSTTIGAIIREDQVIFGNRKEIIEAGDHLILFLSDKNHLKDIEHLFQEDNY